MTSILLGTDQVGVASIDVTTSGQYLTFAVDALGLFIQFDLNDGPHDVTNPDALIGFGVVKRTLENENSWTVQVKFRATVEAACEVVWSATEGSVLENVLLTTE